MVDPTSTSDRLPQVTWCPNSKEALLVIEGNDDGKGTGCKIVMQAQEVEPFRQGRGEGRQTR